MVSVTVTNLNIADVIFADRIVARLSSEHSTDPAKEALITPVGSHFDGLRIAGQQILFDDVSGSAPTTRAAIKNPVPGRFTPQCLLSNLRCARETPAVSIQGNAVVVSDFGRIFLAELLVAEDARRITMLRLEMGSPTEGTVCCGTGDADGSVSP
jgi:hypothetical protein